MKVKLENISKEYRNISVLHDLSIDIHQKIYALIGKSGSGKSTLLKILSGHLPNYDGNIYIDNEKIEQGYMSSKVCYIGESTDYFNFKTRKLIDSIAQFYPNWDMELMNKMIKRFGINENTKYENLSIGMKSMVGMIIGLCSCCEITIFDEVISNADSITRELFYDFVIETYEKQSRTIILSTSLLDEISQIAEDLIILDNGNLSLNCGIDEIREQAFTITGETKAVDNSIKDLNVLNRESFGKYTVASIFDKSNIELDQNLTFEPLSLQKFFTHYVGGDLNEN